jgi:uncharacterized membrane protein YfcA
MNVFLPIAHMDVNLLVILAFGLTIGSLSALTGVGGGFLLTPLLMMIGVPPVVAVGTTPALIAGSAAAGSYTHWRLGNLDLRLGLALLAGSLSTAIGSIFLLRSLQQGGQFDNVVALSYIAILGTVGTISLVESTRAMLGVSADGGAMAPAGAGGGPSGRLLGQMDFRVAQRRMSMLPPLLLGAAIGVLNALGMGGGFVAVPAMIYLLRIPTKVAIATSLFLMVATSSAVSVMQADVNHAVDPFLALTLIVGSAVGAQWGARQSSVLPAKLLRLILGVILLAVAARFVVALVATPTSLYGLAGGG